MLKDYYDFQLEMHIPRTKMYSTSLINEKSSSMPYIVSIYPLKGSAYLHI